MTADEMRAKAAKLRIIAGELAGATADATGALHEQANVWDFFALLTDQADSEPPPPVEPEPEPEPEPTPTPPPSPGQRGPVGELPSRVPPIDAPATHSGVTSVAELNALLSTLGDFDEDAVIEWMPGAQISGTIRGGRERAGNRVLIRPPVGTMIRPTDSVTIAAPSVCVMGLDTDDGLAFAAGGDDSMFLRCRGGAGTKLRANNNGGDLLDGATFWECVLPTARTDGGDRCQISALRGGRTENIMLQRCWLGPAFRPKGGSQHVDVVQTYKDGVAGGSVGDVTIDRCVLFPGASSSIQLGAIKDGYAGVFDSLVYECGEDGGALPDGVECKGTNAITGGGKNPARGEDAVLELYDSDIVGSINVGGPIAHCENTRMQGINASLDGVAGGNNVIDPNFTVPMPALPDIAAIWGLKL